MGKPTICIGENKDADQLRGDREADQRLCFRYLDSTIPLLLKSEISSFKLFSVLVQTGLCRTSSETTLLVFPRGGSYKLCCVFMILQGDRLMVPWNIHKQVAMLVVEAYQVFILGKNLGSVIMEGVKQVYLLSLL